MKAVYKETPSSGRWFDGALDVRAVGSGIEVVCKGSPSLVRLEMTEEEAGDLYARLGEILHPTEKEPG